MTDKLLSLARECGMSECFGNDIDEDWENHYTFSGSGLTAFAERIRQDEREKGADFVLDLLVAAGIITREKAFQARDIARDLNYSDQPSIRSSGTSGSKSDE